MLEAKFVGEVYCIGEDLGIARVFEACRAFKEKGNRVIGMIGSRTKVGFAIENRIRAFCDEFFVATEDGLSGRKGAVSDILKELFAVIEKSTHTKYPDLVYCSGPQELIRAVEDITRDCGVAVIFDKNR